ncbi:UNVERIFIED_CONTAM: hypothetical protein PYX00_009433 [Menopon gallinae]
MSQASVTLNTPQPQVNQGPVAIPQPEGEEKVYSAKLEQIFQSISQLTLLEVAELSDLMKKRLNLPDAPVMSLGAVAAAPAAAAQDEEETQTAQTSFTIKLKSFDANNKIALIKEIKSLIPNMNLVQAKKFVESVPAVVMSDVGKDMADKIKETLTKVGAEIVVE